jgi:hypothetical protein
MRVRRPGRNPRSSRGVRPRGRRPALPAGRPGDAFAACSEKEGGRWGKHGFPHQKEKCTEPVSPSSGNPTDLRRSDCHSESHQPRALRTRCSRDTTARADPGQAPAESNFAQIAGAALLTVPGTVSAAIPCRSLQQSSRLTKTGPTKSAPSRCRLRPAIRLTFAEATATRRAINLGRSVLGASSTLWGLSSRVKAAWDALGAICEVFFSHRSNCACEHML